MLLGFIQDSEVGQKTCLRLQERHGSLKVVVRGYQKYRVYKRQ